MTLAQVMLWGRQIGAVQWDERRGVGVFQYTEDFAASGIQVSPLTMPLSAEPFVFMGLDDAFKGLPGLLADSLPDRFGTQVFNAWLSARGITPGSLNPVELLCHLGRRGMGALEFEPAAGPLARAGRPVNIETLVRTASQLDAELAESELEDMVQVGFSAGGARPKGLLVLDTKTGEFRSDRDSSLADGESWLLKFDGTGGAALANPGEAGPMEYAYALMAQAAGIAMTPCRLLTVGGRRHFMTRRFDRTESGRKLHKQSLAALCHYDFNDPTSYSYEQAMHAIRRISAAPQADCEQLFLRAVFNVVARNQDDHVKNIAFLMWPNGDWRLAPAFDLTYAYNPSTGAKGGHQMSVNGKRENISRTDLLELGAAAGVKPTRAKALVRQVLNCIERWPEFAESSLVPGELIARVARAHRLDLRGLPSAS